MVGKILYYFFQSETDICFTLLEKLDVAKNKLDLALQSGSEIQSDREIYGAGKRRKVRSRHVNEDYVAQTAPFRLLDVFCPSDRDRWYRLKDVFLWSFLRLKLGNISVFSGFKLGQSRFFRLQIKLIQILFKFSLKHAKTLFFLFKNKFKVVSFYLYFLKLDYNYKRCHL